MEAYLVGVGLTINKRGCGLHNVKNLYPFYHLAD